MIKPHPCRKLWCLLAALSFISASYAQDSHHKVLKKVPVQYPEALKERGIQGDVRLKVTIKPTGDVKLTELLGGNPILAESAQKSVAQWRFEPSGAEAVVVVTVHFDASAKAEN